MSDRWGRLITCTMVRLYVFALLICDRQLVYDSTILVCERHVLHSMLRSYATFFSSSGVLLGMLICNLPIRVSIGSPIFHGTWPRSRLFSISCYALLSILISWPLLRPLTKSCSTQACFLHRVQYPFLLANVPCSSNCKTCGVAAI